MSYRWTGTLGILSTHSHFATTPTRSLARRRASSSTGLFRRFTSLIWTLRPIGCQLHSVDNLSARVAGA